MVPAALDGWTGEGKKRREREGDEARIKVNV